MSGNDESVLQSCKTCRFAGPAERWEQQRQCRKRAPIAAHDPALNAGVYPEAFVPRWPMMKLDDWCGDYEPAPGKID